MYVCMFVCLYVFYLIIQISHTYIAQTEYIFFARDSARDSDRILENVLTAKQTHYGINSMLVSSNGMIDR